MLPLKIILLNHFNKSLYSSPHLCQVPTNPHFGVQHHVGYFGFGQLPLQIGVVEAERFTKPDQENHHTVGISIFHLIY